MPAGFQELKAGRGFVGRLETGTDLVEEIERFCLEHSVIAAQVTVIGALRTNCGATTGTALSGPKCSSKPLRRVAGRFR